MTYGISYKNLKLNSSVSNYTLCLKSHIRALLRAQTSAKVKLFVMEHLATYTLCSKKRDAKIQITITTAHLSELIILLAALIITFLAQT